MTNPMKEPKIISNFLSPRQNNLFGGVIPLDPSLCAGLWKCSSLLILNFIDNLGCFHQISEFQQISEKSSPKGSFWRNNRKSEFSELSWDSPNLLAMALNAYWQRTALPRQKRLLSNATLGLACVQVCRRMKGQRRWRFSESKLRLRAKNCALFSWWGNDGDLSVRC